MSLNNLLKQARGNYTVALNLFGKAVANDLHGNTTASSNVTATTTVAGTGNATVTGSGNAAVAPAQQIVAQVVNSGSGNNATVAVSGSGDATATTTATVAGSATSAANSGVGTGNATATDSGSGDATEVEAAPEAETAPEVEAAPKAEAWSEFLSFAEKINSEQMLILYNSYVEQLADQAAKDKFAGCQIHIQKNCMTGTYDLTETCPGLSTECAGELRAFVADQTGNGEL